MMPLWMTVISPVQSRCGWALRSFGRPWVAQRVCARPTAAEGVDVEQGRPQVGELAGLLLHEQVAVLVDQGDAGRVVAAVLEAREPFEQDGPRLARSGVADDAAHVVWFPPVAARAAVQFSRSLASWASISASSEMRPGPRLRS